MPVLQCLGTLKAHFDYNGGKEGIRNHSRRLWNLLLANTKGTHQQSEGIDHSKGVHRSVISGILLSSSREVKHACIGFSNLQLIA